MILYRLCKCVYADDLSGNGARLYGGRWNSEGRAMLYTASSRSLAVLEALVHLSPTNMPDDFCMLTIEAPDDYTILDVETLPKDWREYPEKQILKQTGNNFLKEAKHLLLQVPSALVSEEFNYLLNPMHPNASSVKTISKRAFSFDERLLS
ncbi:RES family NAD+ phosphorylase [Mucilaginibacter auburnensis]|uniref:RES domain-containing protein n=1 Tax=Mucilaginibacter auburnensis TaxID=1457233 RepID=A0A2H9VMP9_9SPHI|nr:RES family NAD+ phosphorylase [Mucilaginibacter auburnensis]PJJ79609.1 RES domain-containing protein [Mucilaginibacter auburnensis]